MSSNSVLLTTFSVVQLALAVWLFSRTLAHREHFALRLVAVLGLTAAATAIAVPQGFSIFPTLTDDASFFIALLTFVGVLALAVASQLVLFESSPWTAVFCCSMAYALANIAEAGDRAVSLYVSFSAYPPPLSEQLMRLVATTFVVYAAVYLLLIRRIERGGLLQIADPVMVLTAAVVIMVNMIMDLVIKDISVPDYALPDRYTTSLMWVYLLLCSYLMYSSYEIVYTRRLQLNMAAVERLRATEAKQYEMSRENIEAINLKCHDLKHQIRSLEGGGAVVSEEVLDELSHKVDVYDSVVKSGNDALDTILTEKSLICQKRGITLSCIADGPALDFMRAADLYSLFGNALDNAIEAVDALGDPERRSISLVVRRAGDMVSVHVENYFDGHARFNGEGLPLTTKADRTNHGFGVRSMRIIVESYGGTLLANAQDDVFHLNALIPMG